MICLAFDPGPKSCGFAVANLTPEMRGRPTFLRGGKVDSAFDSIRCLLDENSNVDIVAVETPAGFIHEHARGAQLLETRGVAGRIDTIARMRSHNVVEMTAGEWRRQLTGKANASDAVIKRAVTMFAYGLPKRTNAHMRDALGLAIVVLRKPSVPLGCIQEYK
jgi:Holliday junction resolvasome RuvABC endonuclease subunit